MERSVISVDKVKIHGDRVEYFLDIQGDVKRYFNLKVNMFVEYGENIEDVPEGIAIIPLLTNLLPIAWFSDSEIIVNEIDKSFYECIEEIKHGYVDRHKLNNLKGKFSAHKIIDYNYEYEQKSATFFSGGVDSFATLITRLNEKPMLVTLWGTDITLDDEEGWERVKELVVDSGEKLGLKNLLIKSNFRIFINESELDRAFYKYMNEGWWRGAQHGIGLIGHIAPFAYIYKIKQVYMPASLSTVYSEISCASHPNIDNKVRMGSCSVVHEGFDNNRQDKIKIIGDHLKNHEYQFTIRVCWESKGGKNCSVCEKCSRTIMGLIAEGIDPNKYGFNVTDNTILNIKENWQYVWNITEATGSSWTALQNKYKEDEELWKNNNIFNWILKINFTKITPKNRSIIHKIKRKIYFKVVKGRRK
ncbi:hypothetical protein K9O30_18470 [Clostridium bowmanii]|uniref:hypothetical protein n=1 Tax=Clostridium bowmanii TaxID=132925 RepID=UPI001C0D096F|nr:hypothetical protein [Clostridium bowmanii]MBU3191224.1 hypothetical protein [Clostridium bowmanii]MCA1075672.1 hypothetical protein [Clostridium bowmanii]